ncbi:MAG: methylcobalamin:coenzyme M methyltransferase [Firmicutes bacterium ADurb.Bin193]|nr:MAG: methylcobalamin:coenzyme M methyltransferase [Firmicutes bacterium ADurb.Bin193]
MSFRVEYTDVNTFKKMNRKPDFNNVLKVLKKEMPNRPTLFEPFINPEVIEVLADEETLKSNGGYNYQRAAIGAYKNAGYDYCSVQASSFKFRSGDAHSKNTISLNDAPLITDRESFEKYVWNNPEDYDYSWLDRLGKELPDGMKFIVKGPSGVLENVIKIVGYDNLCFMLADEPDLASEIFDQVGSRLLKYYEIAVQYDSVGAAVVNDDWGFNTQTMLSPASIKELVVPWHKKIVSAVHSAGKPAVLHSCGNLTGVWDDIIDNIGFDGKHSYEDKIEPVEQAYERLYPRIAVMGGIDMDYICRQTPEEVYNRSKEMLKRAEGRGGYALGSGNSIPDYVPIPNYLAMISAAVFE